MFAKVREKISKIQRGGFYRIWLEKPWFPDQNSESVLESESSSRYVQSRKRTRNRVLDLDSLITGTETGLQDWTLEGIGTAEPDLIVSKILFDFFRKTQGQINSKLFC